jgi:hypothetical protein
VSGDLTSGAITLTVKEPPCRRERLEVDIAVLELIAVPHCSLTEAPSRVPCHESVLSLQSPTSCRTSRAPATTIGSQL